MNKKFLKALALKALVVGTALSFASTTFAADIKLGFVDLKKVFEKYYKTVQSSAASKEEVAEIEKEGKEITDTKSKRRDEWQKLIDKANDQAVSAEERDRSKRDAEQKLAELRSADETLREFEKSAQTKFMEKNRQRRDAIVAEIRAVLDAKAKVKGYSAVLDTSGDSANYAPVLLYYGGDNDMTEDLIKDLNAAAPPGVLSADKPDGGKVNNK